jgi:hypothetical protein
MTAIALPDIKRPEITLPEITLPEVSLPDMDRLRLTDLRNRVAPRARRWPRLVIGLGLAAIVSSAIVAATRSGALSRAGDEVRARLRRWTAPAPAPLAEPWAPATEPGAPADTRTNLAGAVQ